jgi:hypothetical protein
MIPSKRKLKVGDWVEVRSSAEILKTLDSKGELEGMPFMPEMFAFCGQRFHVYRRAHKTCDTVFPTRSRRVDRAVHLETRCNGSAHGGCQAGCLIFWKEEWLKPVHNDSQAGDPALVKLPTPESVAPTTGCTEADVHRAAQVADAGCDGPIYACQATRLPYATADLAWWEVRQYLEDWSSGNVSMGRILSGLIYSAYYQVSQAGIGLGRIMRWFYDKCHPIWAGTPFPRKAGRLREDEHTPTQTLDLQPGELVRVKSHDEILRTLNVNNRNRGLYFDAEMVPYCGGTYRVLKRVTRVLNEKTGKMQELNNPCIVLEGVICQARYSDCRMFCPRSIYPYWREIWLERVQANEANASSGQRVVAASRTSLLPDSFTSCGGVGGRAQESHDCIGMGKE